MAQLAGHIGDPAVRNRGTIGEALANNEPSAHCLASVLVSGARIITNACQIGADDYVQGMFATALAGWTLSGAERITDLHGSGAYRAPLIKVMVQRAVAGAV